MITKEEARQNALEFLKGHETGTLATASPDGRPFCSTVYFSYLPDLSIYFICSHNSAKFKNLTLNPQVAFSVGVGPAYQEVTIHGKVAMVGDADEQERVLKEITARVTTAPNSWPVHVVKSLAEGGTAIFRITPNEAFFHDLTDKDQIEYVHKYIYSLLP